MQPSRRSRIETRGRLAISPGLASPRLGSLVVAWLRSASGPPFLRGDLPRCDGDQDRDALVAACGRARLMGGRVRNLMALAALAGIGAWLGACATAGDNGIDVGGDSAPLQDATLRSGDGGGDERTAADVEASDAAAAVAAADGDATLNEPGPEASDLETPPADAMDVLDALPWRGDAADGSVIQDAGANEGSTDAAIEG